MSSGDGERSVIEFIEDVCNVSGHGEVVGLGLAVPLQVEAEVELSIPV